MRKYRLPLFFSLILCFSVGLMWAEGKSWTLMAHLSGEEAGVDTNAQGQTIFRLSEDGTELYYKLIVANLENTTQAHIHLMQDTVPPTAPVVVWLYPSASPPQLIEGRFSGVLAEGIITDQDLVGPLAGQTLETLLQDIEQGLTYVNVHTLAYPGGEIRGTIE